MEWLYCADVTIYTLLTPTFYIACFVIFLLVSGKLQTMAGENVAV